MNYKTLLIVLPLFLTGILLHVTTPVRAQSTDGTQKIVERSDGKYETLEEHFMMHFHWDKTNFDPDYLTNASELERLRSFVDGLDWNLVDRIEMYSYASPEGVYEHNQYLSRGRSDTMLKYITENYPDMVPKLTTDPRGESWAGLWDYVEADTYLSEASKTAIMKILDSDINVGTKKWRLEHQADYKYLYKTYYPLLRNTGIMVVHFKRLPDPEPEPIPEPEPVIELEPEPEPEPMPLVKEKSPQYWYVKTNLLYDALLVPNIGAEFSLGDRWSIGGNWMYEWIKTDKKHDYWRIYGGDIHVSKWFGRSSEPKPLTGNHIGIYAGIVTYDFELGHRGYLAPRWSYGGGVEYGYSKPIGKRLNLDFTIGVGYLGGKYYEYLPIDQCYVWQCTKHRHFVGPTKLELNLVWQLGRGNVNKKYVKGGTK